MTWIVWDISLLVLVQSKWMMIKPSIKASVLDALMLSIKKDVRDSTALVKQNRLQKLAHLHPNSISVQLEFLPRLYTRYWIYSAKVSLVCLCWPRIIFIYSYTRLGNIMTGLWNIWREYSRRMKHNRYFNKSMVMFGSAIFCGNDTPSYTTGHTLASSGSMRLEERSQERQWDVCLL